MRKKLLDDVGGIAAFGQYLAEDFFFARSFTDRFDLIQIKFCFSYLDLMSYVFVLLLEVGNFELVLNQHGKTRIRQILKHFKIV